MGVQHLIPELRRHAMRANRAGGLVYDIRDAERYERILVLGTDTNTYYASAREFTQSALTFLSDFVQREGMYAAKRAAYVSWYGIAPRMQGTLMAAASIARYGSNEAKEALVQLLPVIARTGYHLLVFAQMVRAMRSFGRSVRRAIQHWFDTYPADYVAFQMTKYRRREGFGMADLLRLAHPRPGAHQASFAWSLEKLNHLEEAHEIIRLYEYVHSTRDEEALISLIRDHRVPWEWVQTDMLQSNAVWEALVEKMPPHALLRNLSQLAARGILSEESSAATYVADRLSSVEYLRSKRVHPFHVFQAWREYQRGYSTRNSEKRWRPSSRLLEALEHAFDGLTAIERGRMGDAPILIAIDRSGSMESLIEDALALAYPFVKHRRDGDTVLLVNTEARPLNVGRVSSLGGFVQSVRAEGGTDLSQVLWWALNQPHGFHGIVVITDNESWAHRRPIHFVLDEYAQKFGMPFCVAIAMASNEYSMFPVLPENKTLNIAGFSSEVPKLVGDMLAGEIGKHDAILSLSPAQMAQRLLNPAIDSGEEDLHHRGAMNGMDVL